MSTLSQPKPQEPATSFVSFRCSEDGRRRIKSEAALRGISVQEMLTRAVEQYLSKETPEAA